MPRSEAIDAIQIAQKRPVCLHPHASPTECSGGIIKAHTVQESLLREIADRGKVYTFVKDMGAIIKFNGLSTPQLVGIGQASTFTGFCGKHDDQLFAPIEKTAVEPCAEHAFLLAYRAVCHELHDKQGVTSLEPHLRQIDRGFHNLGQVLFQRALAGHLAGASAGLRDVQRQKERLDRVLASGQYDVLRYYWISLDRIPDLMCNGCFVPKWDFSGRKIQDLGDLNADIGSLVISLLASGAEGCAVLSWHADHDTTCWPFVRSLAETPDAQIPHALVRLITGNMGNQFWSPKWWEGLSAETQKSILGRFRTSVSADIPPDYLTDDGVRAVAWQVICRHTNAASLGVETGTERS